MSDLVVVLETEDHAQLSVARSLLEAEGIECETEGEGGQEVGGLNPLPGATGPVRLMVAPEDKEEALELLSESDMELDEEMDEDLDGHEEE